MQVSQRPPAVAWNALATVPQVSPLRFAPPAQPDTQPPTPGFGQQHRQATDEEDAGAPSLDPEPSADPGTAPDPAAVDPAATAAEEEEVKMPAAVGPAISDPLPAVGAAVAAEEALDSGSTPSKAASATDGVHREASRRQRDAIFALVLPAVKRSPDVVWSSQQSVHTVSGTAGWLLF